MDDGWDDVAGRIVVDGSRFDHVGRPNRIGVTTCGLRRVEGLELEVLGLDAVDGTPVLDIKPYMAGFAPRGPVREPGWATELMQGYW